MRRALAALMACVVLGCNEPSRPEQIRFLGIPESETSETGPVGLVAGAPRQIKTVTAVSEVPHERYVQEKRAERILAEEAHGNYLYFAISEDRDVPFEEASAWVPVIVRLKCRKP